MAVAPSFGADAGEIREHRVSGVVMTEEGQGISGVAVSGGGKETLSDVEGWFELRLGSGTFVLRASHAEYLTQRLELVVDGDLSDLRLSLPKTLNVSDTITVDAVRASESAPVTKRTIDAEEIAQLSIGQDVPALLEHTPSITWYSDSGVGSNYSYFSLRGINQTRINITLDGAPLNDPAEHALYFNNFKGIADAVDSIQIQRGVGTSTVGSPSYGGSVNFASARLTQDSETRLQMRVGSHATRQASLTHQTGQLGNGMAFFTHASFAESDNYRERSGTEHGTVFFNASWLGERSQLKLVTFSGREKSQLAFLAVDPDTLEQNPRFNPLAEEERDRFEQDFVQLQYVRSVGDRSTMVASLYYNGADGWFRLWDDPVAKSDLLEFGIDQHFVGSMVNVTRTGQRLTMTLGAHYNDFRGDHTLDIGPDRIYRNTGLKTQANLFAKLGYNVGRWRLFGDLQLRWAEFDYRGTIDLEPIRWTFVDPKVGVRYSLTPQTSVYASLGKAEREPSRLDLFAGEDNATVQHNLQAVRTEKVVDLEAGVEHRSERLALQVSLYDMQFEDEIAATGALSDIGLPLRINVDESYRRGLEVDLRWRFNEHWQLTNSASLSRSRIREWTQFYDVFDARGEWIGSEPRVYRNVEPLVDLGLSARWTSPSNLDNTGNSRFRTPEYLTVGLRGRLHLGRWPALGPLSRSRVGLHVDNLFDELDHYPSGYSYLFINRDEGGSDRLDGIPYFYPFAGRTVMATFEIPLS
jgi:iron complex outermembrane receptor protein